VRTRAIGKCSHKFIEFWKTSFREYCLEKKICVNFNGVLIWRLRRALPENRATTVDKSIAHNVGQSVSLRDQQMSEPGSYMELRPMPRVKLFPLFETEEYNRKAWK